MEKVYIMIAVREMYGQRTERDFVSVHSSIQEAEEAAERYNPDYDPSVGCCRLAAGQAAATIGRAVESWEWPDCPDIDWSILPEDLQSALEGTDPNDFAAVSAIFEDCGYVVFEDRGQWYLAKI